MNNHYEAPEALKLGKAQDVILNQKEPFTQPADEFGVPWSTDPNDFDDFDE